MNDAVGKTLRVSAIAGLWAALLVLPFMPFRYAVASGAGVGVVVAGGLAARGYHARRERRIVWRFTPSPVGRRLLPIAGAALLLVGPAFLNPYTLDVVTVAALYAILAMGLNIVVGLAGLLDLGYIAFYGIGAYLYALGAQSVGLPFWLALPLGGAVAALFGLFLGIVTLRLRGDYLAIVTLGFIQIVHLILNNWDSVTNGPNGILLSHLPRLAGTGLEPAVQFYYLIVAVAALTAFAGLRLDRSRIGRAWVAIREDEGAAEAMGVDTTRYKVLAFTLGAAWAGMAGVLFAGKYGFVSPESFTFFESVTVLAMVIVGGMGSFPGAILGAVLIIALPELLRGMDQYRMLVFGAAIVALVVFRPRGLLGSARRGVELATEPPAGAAVKG